MTETATKPTLDELAVKHNVKTVFEITVEDDEGNLVIAYFKKPSRQIMSRALSIEGRDPLGSKELILRNCFLEGDIRIIDDDEMFYGACIESGSMMTFRKATLKKN
jgi:hypothetical protein